MTNHRFSTKLLSVILSVMMVLPMMQPIFAFGADADGSPAELRVVPEVIHTADGDIPVEEDWNEVYPYGTFAFGNYQADIAEPGALADSGEPLPQTILIPVYRLGGTVGRVTAKVSFSPAVTVAPDGNGYVYDYAASGKSDILVEYETPSVIAAVPGSLSHAPPV